MLKMLLYLVLTPQGQLPYIDALPLDYDKRQEVISRYSSIGHQAGESCDDTCWCFREGTRFFLTDLLLAGESPNDVAYLLGRLQGRSHLWQSWLTADGHVQIGWIDQQ